MKLAFSYLLAEEFSCSAIISKNEFAIVSNSRDTSRTILCSAELSMKKKKKKVYNLGIGYAACKQNPT